MGATPRRLANNLQSEESLRILYVVHNILSLTYLREYERILQVAYPNAQHCWSYVQHDRFFRYLEHDRIFAQLPKIDFEEARTIPWDLALFASHGNAHLLPDHTIKVRVQHGIGSGKLALGENYTYGRSWVEREGSVIYDLFLESSESQRAFVARRFPHVADRLRVIGSPAWDLLLEMLPQRQAIRASIGVPEDARRTVLLLSTWDTHSLFGYLHDHPNSFFSTFAPGDHILLAPHPHLIDTYDMRSFMLHTRNAYPHLRFHYSDGHDLIHHFGYLVAADLAITDNTSLSLTYTALKRPLFAYQPHANLLPLTSGTAVKELLTNVPAIVSVAECDDLKLRQTSMRAIDRAANQIAAYPGQSAQRLIEVLSDELRQRMAPSSAPSLDASIASGISKQDNLRRRALARLRGASQAVPVSKNTIKNNYSWAATRIHRNSG